LTVTLTEAVTLPAALRAVKTYVVVAVGETDRLVMVVTSPIALSSEILVAPETVQASVEDCPAVIVEGVAAKLDITGSDAAGGGAGPTLPPPPPPPPQAAVTRRTTAPSQREIPLINSVSGAAYPEVAPPCEPH